MSLTLFGFVLCVSNRLTRLLFIFSTAKHNRVFPSLVEIFGLPPLFNNTLIMFMCPSCAAIYKGVFPSLVEIFGFPPLFNNTLIIFMCPSYAAIYKGVFPVSIFISFIFDFFISNIFFNISTSPILEAINKGEIPGELSISLE